MKKSKKSKVRKKLFRYIVLIVLSLLWFQHQKAKAFQWRGYEAIGGEYLIPLYPIIIYLYERTWEDWRKSSHGEKEKDASR